MNAKTYIINYIDIDNSVILKPKAVESCMNPGTFQITPVKITETEEEICFCSPEGEEVRVEKEAVKQGKVRLEEEAFVPKVYRRNGGCNPCRNCGACSW